MKKIFSILLTIMLCFGGIAVCADTEGTAGDNITVTAAGKVLQKDVDYYLTYRDNVNVGTATIVVNFIGNYSGMQERTFNIVSRKSSGGGSRTPPTPTVTAIPVPTSVPTANPIQEPTEKAEHIAYIEGYNGMFRPESSITRAETAAIFARLISERKNEEIGTGPSSFKDVDNSSRYAGYIAYLEKYNVILGYGDDTFKQNKSITRAEFAVICTRYYEIFNDISASERLERNGFSDINDDYWAARYIFEGSSMGWLKGYDGGMFRPNHNITRAEAICITNRVLNRIPDEKYISDNLYSLTVFSDVSQAHWAFADIIEACNTHMSKKSSGGETWVK